MCKETPSYDLIHPLYSFTCSKKWQILYVILSWAISLGVVKGNKCLKTLNTQYTQQLKNMLKILN